MKMSNGGNYPQNFLQHLQNFIQVLKNNRYYFTNFTQNPQKFSQYSKHTISNFWNLLNITIFQKKFEKYWRILKNFEEKLWIFMETMKKIWRKFEGNF